MSAEIIPLKLTAPQALRMIREIAADSSKIVIVAHALQRMKERRVTRKQVEQCLQKGTIVEGPVLNAHGNWQVNLFRHGAGEELTCPVAIQWAERLIVITVI